MISIKKIIGIVLLTGSIIQGQAQVVSSFNFSLQSKQMTGWVNLSGEPSAAVRTATDPATGISISSVSTANWAPTNGVCAADGYGGGVTPSFFPSYVMNNEWAQYNYPVGGYNALMPQFIISGLNPDSVYYLRMTGSFIYSSWNCSPVQYTVAGATVAPSQYLNTYNNFTMGVTFQRIAPDNTGSIRVYVNTTATTNMANISGIQVLSGSAIVGIPAVAITSPATGDILPEESNIQITATATETGNPISKVEFYADTVKIGEADAAPYTISWNNPNEGHYLITAKATDASGTTNIATINISIESLTSFWSMTGNIGMNADSNFVGNVDSVRLAFRTKNVERMSISPLGNVGIGITTPSAQLHTTGTVRLAGLTSDSTKNRVLVSDTSGNLFYRNVTSLSGRWLYANGTAFDSTDNIGIGTNNTQGYKLAVNGAGIFTKVRIKPQANWPDFVFKKEYQLPELADLEQYITQHQHLPGIQSEAEQLQDGVDVGSHQAALLQKIEELTLYVIKQNKVLVDQHKAMDEQNRKFEQQQLQLQLQQQEIDALKKMIQPKN